MTTKENEMEDFVTIEIAKKLEEKGFKEKCLAYYDVNDNVGLLYNTQYTHDVLPCQYPDLLQCHNTGEAEKQPDDSEYCVDAPTISQVLKWLREEKRIDAGAVWDNRDGKWVGYVNEMDMPDLVGEYISSNTYDSYELAGIAVIECVIDNNLI